MVWGASLWLVVCLSVFPRVLGLSLPEPGELQSRKTAGNDYSNVAVADGMNYEDYADNSPMVILLPEEHFENIVGERMRPKPISPYNKERATDNSIDNIQSNEIGGTATNSDKFRNKDLAKHIDEVASMPEANRDMVQTKYRYPVLPRHSLHHPIVPIKVLIAKDNLRHKIAQDKLYRHHAQIPIKLLIARNKIRHKIALNKLRTKAHLPLLRSSYVNPENQNEQNNPDFLDQMLGSSNQDVETNQNRIPKNVYFSKTETVNLTKLADDHEKGYLLEDKIQVKSSMHYAQSKGRLTNYTDSHTSMLQTVVGEEDNSLTDKHNNDNGIFANEVDDNNISNNIVSSPFAPEHFKGEYKPGYEFLRGQFIEKPSSENYGFPGLDYEMPYAVDGEGKIIDIDNLIKATIDNSSEERKGFIGNRIIGDANQEEDSALVGLAKSGGTGGPREFVDGQYIDGHALTGTEMLGKPSYNNDEKIPTNFVDGQFTDHHALKDNDMLGQPGFKNHENGPTDFVGGQFVQNPKYKSKISIPEITTINNLETDLNKDLLTGESISEKEEMQNENDFVTESTDNVGNTANSDFQNKGTLRRAGHSSSSDEQKNTFNKGTNSKTIFEDGNVQTPVAESDSILESETSTDQEINMRSQSRGPFIDNIGMSPTTHTPEQKTFLGNREDFKYIDESPSMLGISILLNNNGTDGDTTDRVSRSPEQATEENLNGNNRKNNLETDSASEVDGIKSDSSNILTNKVDYPDQQDTTTLNPSQDSLLGARLTTELHIYTTNMVDEVELYAGENQTYSDKKEFNNYVPNDSNVVPKNSSLFVNDILGNNTTTNICFSLQEPNNPSLFEIISGKIVLKTENGTEIPLYVKSKAFLENCNSGTEKCRLYLTDFKNEEETSENKSKTGTAAKSVKKRDTTNMESEFIKSLFGFQSPFEASKYKSNTLDEDNIEEKSYDHLLNKSQTPGNKSNIGQSRILTVQITQPSTLNNSLFYVKYFKTILPNLKENRSKVDQKCFKNDETSPILENEQSKIDKIKKYNWFDFFQRHHQKRDIHESSRQKRTIKSETVKSCSCDSNAILRSPLKPTLTASHFVDKRLEIMTNLVHSVRDWMIDNA